MAQERTFRIQQQDIKLKSKENQLQIVKNRMA